MHGTWPPVPGSPLLGVRPGYSAASRLEDLRYCRPCGNWYDRSRGPHVCPYLDAATAPPRPYRLTFAALFAVVQAGWIAFLAWALYKLVQVASG